MLLRPFAPSTIKSACCVAAKSRISSAGLPTTQTGCEVNPASISFWTSCSTKLLRMPTSCHPGYLTGIT